MAEDLAKYESKWTGKHIDDAIDLIDKYHDELMDLRNTIDRISDNGDKIKGLQDQTTLLMNQRLLPLAGGTMDSTAQIITTRAGGGYDQATSNALIRYSCNNEGSAYNPIYSCATLRGDFSAGPDYSIGSLVWRFKPSKGPSFQIAELTNDGCLLGACWNDIAEFRQSNECEAGRVICECGDGYLKRSTKRLQPGAEIVSDTFGYAIGKTEKCKTPIAIAGRVLAYPNEDRSKYKPGDAVCAGPNGTVSKMSRREVRRFPDRIIGTVSEIPNYETWGTANQIKINGRIWIRIK